MAMTRNPLVPVCFDYLANRPICAEKLIDGSESRWFGAMGYTRAEASAAIAERSRREHWPFCLVALCRGQLAGMASLVEDVLPDRRIWVPCLADVYVAPAWRGRGIGTSLCLRMLEEARNFRLQELSLYTTDREEFYTRLGWSKQCDALVETEDGYQLAAFMKRPVGTSPACEHGNLQPVEARGVAAEEFCSRVDGEVLHG